MPTYSQADAPRLVADTKSIIKLDGFRSGFEASYVSSHTEETWYNETVSAYIYIYIYI